MTGECYIFILVNTLLLAGVVYFIRELYLSLKADAKRYEHLGEATVREDS